MLLFELVAQTKDTARRTGTPLAESLSIPLATPHVEMVMRL